MLFYAWVSHWTWNWMFRLEWLYSEPSISTCLFPLEPELETQMLNLEIYMVLRIEIRTSSLQTNVFTHRDIFPTLIVILWKYNIWNCLRKQFFFVALRTDLSSLPWLSGPSFDFWEQLPHLTSILHTSPLQGNLHVPQCSAASTSTHLLPHCLSLISVLFPSFLHLILPNLPFYTQFRITLSEKASQTYHIPWKKMDQLP